MKKIISGLLAIILVFGCFGIFAFAADEKPEVKQYPYVFVHGMMGWGSYDKVNGLVPYWGLFNGDMLKEFEKQGIECYSASVGKISSNWDRACELYAQLTGTVVDYGEAHSAEHKHLRYGRSYEGSALMDSFGKTDENGDTIKINLVGHSLGGPTVRLFAWLLANGSEEEIAASGEDVSEFFKGGKADYIYSVTTMSAPHNGAPASNTMYDKLPTAYFLAAMGAVLGSAGISHFWDFQLEQYGLTAVPEQGIKAKFSMAAIKDLVSSDDNCGYDLTVRGAKSLNDMIDTVDSIYYFAYTGEKAIKQEDGTYKPPADMFPLFTPFARKMGKYDGSETLDGVPMTEEWRQNDGMVPVISGTAPFDEEYVYYEDVKDNPLETGVWHVMPLIDNFSHVSYMGMDTNNFKFVYDGLVSVVGSTMP